ncbi:hypothetical protein CRG98_028590 [Punica granatum]|uniref:Uncharacterized protein n=1 Tax=Punica granatum TaxID=22663 RepID=A0A2I0J461_PUNGR|nr:hypothetical protein CRG98_028590 [Punica granatum]
MEPSEGRSGLMTTRSGELRCAGGRAPAWIGAGAHGRQGRAGRAYACKLGTSRGHGHMNARNAGRRATGTRYGREAARESARTRDRMLACITVHPRARVESGATKSI